MTFVSHPTLAPTPHALSHCMHLHAATNRPHGAPRCPTHVTTTISDGRNCKKMHPMPKTRTSPSPDRLPSDTSSCSIEILRRTVGFHRVFLPPASSASGHHPKGPRKAYRRRAHGVRGVFDVIGGGSGLISNGRMDDGSKALVPRLVRREKQVLREITCPRFSHHFSSHPFLLDMTKTFLSSTPDFLPFLAFQKEPSSHIETKQMKEHARPSPRPSPGPGSDVPRPATSHALRRNSPAT